MKIKLNKRLKRIISAIKDEDENETKADVIDFETIKRKGAEEIAEESEELKEEKSNVSKVKKILVGMSMLLVLTLIINLKPKNIFKLDIAEIVPPESETIPVSSTIESDDAKIVKAKEELIFIPALEGEVQKIYSKDKVIYSKTLNQWKTHDGIDISPSKSNTVVAIEKGVVDSIYTDDFYGKTIKIEHIDGYVSVYSNLEENVFVNVGESVIKGQKIGKVGNTSVGEALDNPHLHFTLYLNNNIVNPTYIFK